MDHELFFPTLFALCALASLGFAIREVGNLRSTTDSEIAIGICFTIAIDLAIAGMFGAVSIGLFYRITA